jgi:hypothetical protein
VSTAELSRASTYPESTELSQGTLNALKVILDSSEFKRLTAEAQANSTTLISSLGLAVGGVVSRVEATGVQAASANEMDAIDLLSQYIFDAIGSDTDDGVCQAVATLTSALKCAD